MDSPRSGRAGTVVDLGDGLVRKSAPGSDLVHEARAMDYASIHGFPVPALVSYSQDEIMMEKINGVTMAQDLTLHPWRLRTHARTLAELHQRLHQISTPKWLEPNSTSDSLLHLDLHIENVMICDRGPVVIDWANCAAGPAGLDVALTWVIMATSLPDAGVVKRQLSRWGSALFVSAFLSSFDEDEIKSYLPRAGQYRSRDRNIQPEEAERVRRMIRRQTK